MALIHNVNHKNMIVMWNFLKGYAQTHNLRGEDINIFTMLNLPYPKEYPSALRYYTDPYQWSPLETYVECYLKTKEVTGNPNTFRECGRSVTKYRSWSQLQQLMHTVSGPAAALNYLPMVVPDWNDTKIFEMVEPAKYSMFEKRVKAIIKYTFHPYIIPSDDYCSDPHILGLLEAMPSNWPKHFYKPWEMLPLADIKQVLVQYDPVKLFSGKFFMHLDLQPFFDGDDLYIHHPLKNHISKIGKKVLLVPTDVNGKQEYMGNYKELQKQVSEHDHLGTLILETITVDGEPVCEEGVIMEAPYFLVHYSCEELAITQKIWNIRDILSGNKITREELFKTNEVLREEVEERKAAHKKLQLYTDKLEDIVQERTAELTDTLNKLKETQNELIHSAKMASLGTLAAGIAHEINNGITAIDRSSEHIAEYLVQFNNSCRWLIKSLSEHDVQILEEITKNIFNDALQEHPFDTSEIRKRVQTIGDECKAKNISVSNRNIKILASFKHDLLSLPETITILTSPFQNAIIEYFDITHKIGITLNNITSGKNRIKDIVNAIKRYSHLGSEDYSEIDIHENLNNTLFLIYNQLKYGIEVEKDFQNNLPLISGNPGEISQVWTNIIINAVQAMEGVGKLTIKTLFKTVEDRKVVSVLISDTGPGIPDEILYRIFDPFFTTKDVGYGTGIGLSIADKIIKKHDGKIDVSSVMGEGTTFEILLPINNKNMNGDQT